MPWTHFYRAHGVALALLGSFLFGLAALVWTHQTAIDNRPSWSQVREMIEREAPYNRDRDGILARLMNVERSHDDIRAAMLDNSQRLQSIKTEVEKRLVVQPSDVLRKLEEIEAYLKAKDPHDG